jgi:SLOG cluster2
MSDPSWIALSGAVPAKDELLAHGWSELGIREFVSRLVDRVMRAGGGIAMGSHPTFMNVIRDVAKAHTPADGPKRWKIWVGKRFIPDEGERAEYEAKYGPYADITWVGELDPPGPLSAEKKADLRQAVLTDLRTRFIKASRALVCVGGRPTRTDEGGNLMARAGVEQEAEIAWGMGLPLYLVGAGGGVAGTVYRKLYKRKLTRKRNGLTADVNELIATNKDPFLGVSYVIEGLRSVKVL